MEELTEMFFEYLKIQNDFFREMNKMSKPFEGANPLLLDRIMKQNDIILELFTLVIQHKE